MSLCEKQRGENKLYSNKARHLQRVYACVLIGFQHRQQLATLGVIAVAAYPCGAWFAVVKERIQNERTSKWSWTDPAAVK